MAGYYPSSAAINAPIPQPTMVSNAEACLQMAQNAVKKRPGYVEGGPHVISNAQSSDENFLANSRLAETVRNNLKKLDQTIHKSMSPGIFLDLQLDEICKDLESLLQRTREQQDKLPKSYLQNAPGVATLPDPALVFVDNLETLDSMLVSMSEDFNNDLGGRGWSIDLEGYHLSRQGTISLIQIFIPSINIVYLIHIATLGKEAFTTPASTGSVDSEAATLKAFLESTDLTKLFWDCRSDSDALYHLYGVKLAGVIDVQLWDVATRGTAKDRKKLKSLFHALTQRLKSRLSGDTLDQWSLVKDAGIRAHQVNYDEAEKYYLANGGTLPVVERVDRSDSAVSIGTSDDTVGLGVGPAQPSPKDAFAQNPFPPLLQIYAMNDVRVLPIMLDHFTVQHRFWTPEWEHRVRFESEKRAEDARLPEFIAANAPVRNRAPEGWKDVEQVDRFAKDRKD